MGKLIELGSRLVIFRTTAETQAHRRQLLKDRQIAAARENASEQRAKRVKRTVRWADRAAIKKIYFEAYRLSRKTGIPHEVDHIFPLLGEFVSGLHVEGNLQIISQLENRKKSNFYMP